MPKPKKKPSRKAARVRAFWCAERSVMRVVGDGLNAVQRPGKPWYRSTANANRIPVEFDKYGYAELSKAATARLVPRVRRALGITAAGKRMVKRGK